MPSIEKRKYTLTNFIGTNMASSNTAVFFDPNTAVANNLPAITAVAGDSGAGKTFFSQHLLTTAHIMGKTTVAIDFKSDLLRMHQLEDEIGPIQNWVLNDPKSKGALDPIYLTSDRTEQLEWTVGFIEILVGSLMTPRVKQAVYSSVKDLLNEKRGRRSLSVIVKTLRSSPNQEVAMVGNELDMMSEQRGGHLCFYPGDDRPAPKEFIGKTTVITFFGMKPPETREQAEGTSSGRLITGILYLVTQMISKVLLAEADGRPRVLFIDEAWMIMGNRFGAEILNGIGRLGRSRGTACVVITQYLKDFEKVDIGSSVSSYFVFRTKGNKEAKDTAVKMGLSESMDNTVSTLNTLSNGACIYKDIDDEVSKIRIEPIFDSWSTAFNTNPFKDNHN